MRKPLPENVPVVGRLSSIRPPWQADLWNGLGGSPKERQYEEYTKMLRVDYQARQAVNFSTNLILNLIDEYQHPDPRITEFVRAAFARLRGSWTATLRWLLRARIYGFSVAEKIWEPARLAGRPAWIYRGFAQLAPESLQNRGLVFNRDSGELEEVVQWRQFGSEGIRIPAAKVAYWAHEDPGDGYGTALGECMLPLYRAKQSSMEAWQVAAKYRGMPQIYVVVPDGRIQDAATKEEISNVEAEAKVWEATKSAGVIVRPGVPGEWGDKGLPRVQQLQGESFGDEFLAHIRWIDGAYLMALGVPALVQMEGQFGTRAQSAVHSDAAKFGALPIAQEFAETCLIEQLVRPLLDVNFGEQEDYGTFPCSIPIDEEFVANILTALNTAGFLGLMVDERIYRHWQAQLPQYLPEIEEGDYEPEEKPQPLSPGAEAPPEGVESGRE